MDEPAATITLVNLQMVEPIYFPNGIGVGHVFFDGPAPDGITIGVTSSHPHVMTVDFPTVGLNPGEFHSFTILLTPQALGTTMITVTSANSLQAEVTVKKNPKEQKDGKESKEGFKEGKEGAKDVELQNPTGSNAAGNRDSDEQAGHGRAFIRSDERPALRIPQINPEKSKSADAGHRSRPL